MNSRITRTVALISLIAVILSACQPARQNLPGDVPVSQNQPGAARLKGIQAALADLPPQVIDRSPAIGQEAALDGAVEVSFDQTMDTARTESAWQMRSQDGKPVDGTFSWPQANRLRFTPRKPLDPGVSYEITIGEQAAAQNGIPLQGGYRFKVNTITPLQVSQVFPVPGSSQIEASGRITVTFNRPVVPLGILEEQAALVQPLTFTPPASGQGEWISTSVYVFTANPPLKSQTNYTVTIKAGLEDAVKTPGTALPDDFSWSFTTLAPSLGTLQVGKDEMNPSEPYEIQDAPLDAKMILAFRQPMDKENMARTLSLLDSGGQVVSLRLSWNPAGDTVTAAPAALLVMGSQYTLVLGAETKAADGGSLGKESRYAFRTINPPGIRTTIPSNGDRDTVQSFEIDFESPMNLQSIVSHITFQPALEKKDSYWYDDREHKIFFYGLKPSTTYQVTLAAGMLDLYGNAINQGARVNFTTAAIPPHAMLVMPYEALFRAKSDQEFVFRYTNVRSVDLSLYRISAQEYIDNRESPKPFEEYLPNQQNLVWQYRETSSGALDEMVYKLLKLQGKNGQPLDPGFYFLGLSSEQVPHKGTFQEGRFLVVTSANLTFKSSVNDGLVWATGFEDGKPLSGLQIKVVDRQQITLASGRTGSDGLVKLSLPAAESAFESRYVMSEGENFLAFASNGWGSGSSPEDFGIWEQYYGPLNDTRAYLYTERPLYRPGQPVYFKGIVRRDNDLAYSLPDLKQVEVVIKSYDEEIYRETLPLSDFGSFNGQLLLDGNAALGQYSLSANFPGSQTDLGFVNFTVAEYRKPEFQIDLSVDPQDVAGGSSFKAALLATYYSGGGLDGANVTWSLRSDPFYYRAPDEFSSYSFYDDDRDSERYLRGRSADPSELVAEGTGITGADGKLLLSLPADISKFGVSRTLSLDVTVTDLSNFSVSAQAQVIAHQSRVYAGIRPESYVAQAGKEQAFNLAALDWAGSPAAGQKLNVVINQREWFSVQEQDAQGSLRWTNTVKETPVANFTGVSVDSQGKALVKFTPQKGGVYRAIVTAADGAGKWHSASAYMWVSGSEFIPWRQTNDRTFELITDRDSYRPGETAEILIASPFQGSAYALVTVERGQIRSQEVILLEGNSTVYRLPVSKDMAPLVYVSVLVVKGIDDTNPRPNFKIGMAKINVSTEQQALDVTITPDRPDAGPGEELGYTIETRDTSGHPVQAEVSLGLSDLATLSLLPSNSTPILDYFYAPRALSVRTAVAITMNIEDYNAVLEESEAEGRGAGSGGGKGDESIGVPLVRQNFPDTAFWKADLVTAADGKASVKVKLPDNLTTWRMDARAATADTRVGQSTQDLISTRPLLVRPQTPRFFVEGDQVVLGMAVHNNTGQDLRVEAALEARNITLEGENPQTIEIKNGRQAYVTWKASVPAGVDRVDLLFKASGGEFADASRPTLGTLVNNGIPVYRFEAPESVATSGQLETSGERAESVRLPQNLPVQRGDLRIKIEPSLAAGMTGGLTYLEHYPYECTEQTVSRFLPNVLSSQALRAAGMSSSELDSALKTQVNTALQKLYNQQNSDGGWGWWGGEKSDTNTTAYVVLGLVEAQKAGYTVDGQVLERGTDLLRGRIGTMMIQPGGAANGGRDRQAFVLYVLARAGYPAVSKTTTLYQDWQSLQLYGRGLLAQTLALIDARDPRIKDLVSNIASAAILTASGAHWEEASEDYWNWNTNTRTTAILLDTLIKVDPNNTLAPNAVRWLMANRVDGRWRSTQETAWTLMALTGWMVQSGELEAAYTYTAELNGTQVLDGSANQDNLRTSRQTVLQIDQLQAGQPNPLVIRRQGDQGNLYYTADLKVYLPAAEIRALSNGLTLSRSYYRLDNSKTPVQKAAQGDLLLVKLTVVAPHDLHNLLIEDPLPAGMEAVDTSLKSSPQGEAPEAYNWERIGEEGWGWWYFSHAELRDEKLVLSTARLPAGTYVYTYLVRASTPGTFQVIPPTGQEFYFPEVYGRGAGSLFEITL